VKRAAEALAREGEAGGGKGTWASVCPQEGKRGT